MRSAIIIDGVHVDPQTLSCLDASGAPLAITRMGVKELRAELAARRAPVAGNKKELAKRLQVGVGELLVLSGSGSGSAVASGVAKQETIADRDALPAFIPLLQKLRQLDGSRSTSLAKLRADQKAERGKVRLPARRPLPSLSMHAGQHAARFTGGGLPVEFLAYSRISNSRCLSQVSVVVTDKMWVDGKVVQETRYESEKEIDAPQEEDGEDTPEWDVEEEEASWPQGGTHATRRIQCQGSAANCGRGHGTRLNFCSRVATRSLTIACPASPCLPSATSPLQAPASSSRRSAIDEEVLFDDDLTSPAYDTPLERYILASLPHFSSHLAGPHEAASMLLGAVTDMHAQPSNADLQVLSSYCQHTGDVPAAVLLAAALGRLSEPPPHLLEDVTAFCSSHEVDLGAAVEAVLRRYHDPAAFAAAEAGIESDLARVGAAV